jgi:hypothetical protein
MKRIKQAMLALSIMIAAPLMAQTTGSIFALEGDYIKIGVSDYGTIGSKGNASPGIMYDNTGTRTFNPSYDYLTPGAPFEGFTIKASAGGTPFSVTNNNMGGGPLTGILTNYSGIAYGGSTFDNRAVWVSTNNANFDLTNDVRFNNAQKYVDITSSLTAKVAMTDLYFARFIDPDARAAAGDSSATTNTLGFSPIPATNVVFSEALASRYALGLYSAASSNVGTGISSAWSTDPITYYSGTNDGNGDYTIGIAFRVPSMGVSDLATFRYAYIFGPSTLTAGAYAVSSGAAGGTAGVVPGCTSGCEMEGVTPPTSTPDPTPAPTPEPDPGPPPAPPAPTVVSSEIGVIYSRMSIFNRQPAEKVLGIRNTVSESSLPFTTNTWSDGSTTVDYSAPINAETVADYSTRIDQYQYMDKANQRFNLQLDSNVLDRFTATKDGLFPRATLGKDAFGYTYITADGQRTNTNSDGYYMTAQRFGFGHEKQINPAWVVGGQFNNITANLYGDQASGNLQKNSVAAYSLYNMRGWLFKTDLGISMNDFKNAHTLNDIAELGPLSAGGKTSGRDIWFNQRVYTPDVYGFRPYAGIRVENNQRNGLDEAGNSLIAMSYGAYSQTQTFGDFGVRYENNFGVKRLNVLAEVGSTTNSITYGRAGVSYRPTNNVMTQLTLGQQQQSGVTNNIIQGQLKLAF